MIAKSRVTTTTRPSWLKPDELARLNSLELRARGVVEGFFARSSSQSVYRLQRRVFIASPLWPRRRFAARELEGFRAATKALRQRIRCGNEPESLFVRRRKPLDAVQDRRCDDQARIRRDIGRGDGLAGDETARRGGPRFDRRRREQLYGSVGQAGPLGRLRADAISDTRPACHGIREVTRTSRGTRPSPWDRRYLQRPDR